MATGGVTGKTCAPAQASQGMKLCPFPTDGHSEQLWCSALPTTGDSFLSEEAITPNCKKGHQRHTSVMEPELLAVSERVMGFRTLLWHPLTGGRLHRREDLVYVLKSSQTVEPRPQIYPEMMISGIKKE